MRRLKELLKDESGMGLVEIAIIIIIVIALALIFQNEITDLMTSIFNKIELKLGGLS